MTGQSIPAATWSPTPPLEPIVDQPPGAVPRGRAAGPAPGGHARGPRGRGRALPQRARRWTSSPAAAARSTARRRSSGSRGTSCCGRWPWRRGTFTMAARNPAFDLHLAEGTSYYTIDGCGVAAIDPETRPGAAVAQVRPRGARRGSRTTCRPSASCGRRSAPRTTGGPRQLHEIDAADNNTVKHFQAMVMGEDAARYRRGDGDGRRGVRRGAARAAGPVEPGVLDRAAGPGSRRPRVRAGHGRGRPAGRLPRPCRPWARRRRPRSAGAFVVGDAEVISGIVLLQLAFPGTPVFHSIMKAYADPRTGTYVGYSLDSGTARYAPVEMAHHWGVPSLAACFGTDSPVGRDVAGGLGRRARSVARRARPARSWSRAWASTGPTRCCTRRAIFLDNEIYQRARYCAACASRSTTRRWRSTSSPRWGPAGHYLAEEHTRDAHADLAHARPRARARPRPVPGSDRGRPRAGGVGARQPPPGAARGRPSRRS